MTRQLMEHLLVLLRDLGGLVAGVRLEWELGPRVYMVTPPGARHNARARGGSVFPRRADDKGACAADAICCGRPRGGVASTLGGTGLIVLWGSVGLPGCQLHGREHAKPRGAGHHTGLDTFDDVVTFPQRHGLASFALLGGSVQALLHRGVRAGL